MFNRCEWLTECMEQSMHGCDDVLIKTRSYECSSFSDYILCLLEIDRCIECSVHNRSCNFWLHAIKIYNICNQQLVILAGLAIFLDYIHIIRLKTPLQTIRKPIWNQEGPSQCYWLLKWVRRKSWYKWNRLRCYLFIEQHIDIVNVNKINVAEVVWMVER